MPDSDQPTQDAVYDGTPTGRKVEADHAAVVDARDVARLNEALVTLIAEFGPLTVATTAADCLDAELLQELIADLIGEDDRAELYTDAAGETRWRLVNSGNHQVLADSGEGYVNRREARRMARRATGRRPVTGEVLTPGLTAEISRRVAEKQATRLDQSDQL